MSEWTPERLIAFESKVAAAFERKEIRGPIHLCSDGQAEPLLEVFKMIRPEDWVFATWRNHWHALLKGVPEDELFAAICAGRSMYFCSARHRVLCSAIVGGILPIALGVAMGIKRAKEECPECQGTGEVEGNPLVSPTVPCPADHPRVWVFIGDMARRTGLFHEFAQYATGHGLNIRVIEEDNGYSTNANTEELWGGPMYQYETIRYGYVRNRPHTGIGRNITF